MVRRRLRRDASSASAVGRFHHGRDEAAAWLRLRGLREADHWHVEISLDADAGSRFQLNVYAEEWGVTFHHAGRSSCIRVTDIPFVHGRDDFGFLRQLPVLEEIGGFLVELESTHGIKLVRSSAKIRSNVDKATAAVRRWLQRARTS